MSGFITQARQGHPEVKAAFRFVAEWCDGHLIDGAPAIAHARKVIRTLAAHCPDAHVHVIAAADGGRCCRQYRGVRARRRPRRARP